MGSLGMIDPDSRTTTLTFISTGLLTARCLRKNRVELLKDFGIRFCTNEKLFAKFKNYYNSGFEFGWCYHEKNNWWLRNYEDDWTQEYKLDTQNERETSYVRLVKFSLKLQNYTT